MILLSDNGNTTSEAFVKTSKKKAKALKKARKSICFVGESDQKELKEEVSVTVKFENGIPGAKKRIKKVKGKSGLSAKSEVVKVNYISKETLVREVVYSKRKHDNLTCSKNIIETLKDTRNKVKEHSPDESDFSDLNCPICFELLVAATATVCGHTFCDRCLMESLILSSFCPICRTPLRSYQTSFTKTIDRHIEKFVDGSKDEKVKETFYKRKAEWEKWQNDREVKDLPEGSRLDVRDTEYIWCVGVLKKKVEKKNSLTFLIHYEGWNRVYDEYIPLNSQRLAPLGTFTSRKDIPKYTVNVDSTIDTGGAMFSSVISGRRANDGINVGEVLDYDSDLRNLGAGVHIQPSAEDQSNESLSIRFSPLMNFSLFSFDPVNRGDEAPAPNNENDLSAVYRSFQNFFSRFLTDGTIVDPNAIEEL